MARFEISSYRDYQFLHPRAIHVLTVESWRRPKVNGRVRAVNEPHERLGDRNLLAVLDVLWLRGQIR